MVNKTVLCLGSNIGNRRKNIREAVSLLEEECGVQAVRSPVYETPPLYSDDPAENNYYNCCICFDTDLGAKELFKMTSSIEEKMGRTRSFPNAPRIIDIDIIFCGEYIIADETLTVPHPGMQDRKFVLKPLSDIMGKFVHPAIGLTINDLLDECADLSWIKEVEDFWADK